MTRHRATEDVDDDEDDREDDDEDDDEDDEYSARALRARFRGDGTRARGEREATGGVSFARREGERNERARERIANTTQRGERVERVHRVIF